jgi:type IV pilus assembly protein PilN
VTRINLYPWRLEQAKQRAHNFFISLIVTSIAITLFMLIDSRYYSNQIKQQMNNNTSINQEIINTNIKLKDISEIKLQIDNIMARLSVLQKIDSDRHSTIKLLNEIMNLMNPSIVLQTINRVNNTVTITGYSGANSGVTEFLRSIELSSNFKMAELKKIQIVEQKENNYDFNNFFELTFMQNFHEEIAMPEIE